MDKNTLLGLLLMGGLIFGFLYCGAGNQEKNETTDAVANNTEQTDVRKAVDTLEANAGSRLLSAVRTIGVPAADGSLALSGANYSIVVDAEGNLSGDIQLADTTLAINKVLANETGNITPEQKFVAVSTVNDIITNAGRYKSFGKFLNGNAEKVTLSNNVISVDFSSRGGIIEQVTLLDSQYVTELTTPPTQIKLFTPETAGYGFKMQTEDNWIDTRDLNFTITQQGDSSVIMSLPLSGKSQWAIKYTLKPDDYLVSMEIIQQGMSAILPASTSDISFAWHEKLARNEMGRTFEEQKSGLFYKFVGEGPEDLSANSNDSKNLSGQLKWFSFKNQFFSSVIIGRQNFTSATVTSTRLENDPDYLKDFDMTSTIPYTVADGNALGFDFYFGPNDYPILSSIDDKLGSEDLELTRLIPLGWGIFRWINTYLIIPVFNFLGSFDMNYGIIILLLTIIIKIILFPLTFKSYKSQAKMRLLAPEIKQINDKYPDKADALKKQQETMALYKRAGASPFSGCLPMLLQMPILIAMFSFFPSAIELRGQSFLWAHDLSAPDVICTLPFSIPFYGNHVSLFCLLMTVVNVIYTRITMQNQPGGNSMPGMKWMMYLMPVMFLFFFNDYASGLSYYYFLSLLITILQTWITRKVIDEKKMREEMLANAAKPRKKSGWVARLEEAQRKQQAAIRQQQNQKGKRR